MNIPVRLSLGFIGPAPLVYELLTLEEVANSDDDQLYHTKIYLDKRVRDIS